MIRKETEHGWDLITHGEHARLAGAFADAWGNEQFEPPSPQGPARIACYRHDDGWARRDAMPFLTKAGMPEAFTKELVGSYSAFEEIDLPAYLNVRDEATRAVAKLDLHAAVLVSMHTVNLLTEQADLTSIRPEHRAQHGAFITAQRAFQQQAAQELGLSPADLDRAFRFLQACDNLSLLVCCDFQASRPLRHGHPDREGRQHALVCTPLGDATYRIAPFPFKAPVLQFSLEYRPLNSRTFRDQEHYRDTFTRTLPQSRTVTLIAA